MIVPFRGQIEVWFLRSKDPLLSAERPRDGGFLEWIGNQLLQSLRWARRELSFGAGTLVVEAQL